MQLFKKIIILFWSLWWLTALWTDVIGALSHLNWLKASWAQDVNYPFLVKSLDIYTLPVWICPVLFTGIILWSLLNTILFIYASVSLNKPHPIWLARAKYAFVVSLCFWLAYFLSDQLVMKYDLEENHMIQGGFELLTFLCVYIFPEK